MTGPLQRAATTKDDMAPFTVDYEQRSSREKMRSILINTHHSYLANKSIICVF